MERLKSQFKVGDKVVCINDLYTVRDPKCMYMNFPKKGKAYTVRGFYNWRFSKKVNPIVKIKSFSKSEISLEFK